MISYSDEGRPKSFTRVPRTAKGSATKQRLLDAAALEFGELGYRAGSIVGITRRAGTSLGSLYVYFDNKEAVFKALVKEISLAVGRAAASAVTPGAIGPPREAETLTGFLAFVREHKEIYRIIDEAEFSDPFAWRNHYDGAAQRIRARLDENVAAGTMAQGDNEVRAWAIMGMNVFLGLRFGVWAQDRAIEDVVAVTAAMLRDGLAVSEVPAPDSR